MAFVMLVFLALNGYELSYTQKELRDTILDLASGNIDEEDVFSDHRRDYGL